MWLKFKKHKDGKPVFELGAKRHKGDPIYDDFKGLAKAIEDLRKAVKVTFIKDVKTVSKLFKCLRNGVGN